MNDRRGVTATDCPEAAVSSKTGACPSKSSIHAAYESKAGRTSVGTPIWPSTGYPERTAGLFSVVHASAGAAAYSHPAIDAQTASTKPWCFIMPANPTGASHPVGSGHQIRCKALTTPSCITRHSAPSDDTVRSSRDLNSANDTASAPVSTMMIIVK